MRTMKRTFWLRDMRGVPTPSHDSLTPAEQAEARRVLAARGLRFDNLGGVMRDDNGWLSRPSGYVHDPHATAGDVMQWEFSRYINNGASRIRRGFSV